MFGKNTSKCFLESTLSIQKMYNMYVESCNAGDKDFVSEKLYENIFQDECNLSFHRPK